eukprot:gene9806-11618_t
MQTLQTLTLDMLFDFSDDCATVLQNACMLETLRLLHIRQLTHVGFVERLRSVTLEFVQDLRNYDALLRVRTLRYLHVAMSDAPARYSAISGHPTLQTLVLLETRTLLVDRILRSITSACVLSHLTLSRSQMLHTFSQLPPYIVKRIAGMCADVREDTWNVAWEFECYDDAFHG